MLICKGKHFEKLIQLTKTTLVTDTNTIDNNTRLILQIRVIEASALLAQRTNE